MLPRMVAVGEETGTLSRVLIRVADFHEKQLHSYIKRMTLLIEPVHDRGCRIDRGLYLSGILYGDLLDNRRRRR